MTEITRAAHAVMLPIATSIELDPWLVRFLEGGGRTILLGETGEEYDIRTIDPARQAVESPKAFLGYLAEADRIAGAQIALVVDAEPTGVRRLQYLVPSLPGRAELAQTPTHDIEGLSASMARVARAFGVAMFLGPVLDRTGDNVWLQGRTLSADPAEIARIATAYICGVQDSGIVATAKHFPGHMELSAHPMFVDITLTLDRADVDLAIAPFRGAVSAGVEAVMIGPVSVDAIDPALPAGLSPVVIRLLREDLGFGGLVVSDDLDAASTCQGRSVGETCALSLAAGVDLLLVPGGGALEELATAVVEAVDSGRLPASRLLEAAARVGAIADRPRPAPSQVA